MNWLMRQWYANRPNYFLIPFSFIYRIIIFLRSELYYYKFKKVKHLPVPVIVVGNITVGGTGKTPLVIWLANFLQQQGYKPGIVSRGYGNKAPYYPYAVTPQSDAKEVGDEPLLIAQETHCPVVIDSKRPDAAKYLLANNDCNIVISDDGLQHFALRRDIEIVVIDGERRFGNGYCLPAGPLRESVNRLDNVDFIVTNGKSQTNEYAMQLLPGQIYNLKQPDLFFDVAKFSNHPIHAVAAIGNPKRFFNTLKQLGFNNIIEHPFPDHYKFKKQDFEFAKNNIIIMTEKDAVKCRTFSNTNFWCLPVKAELDKTFVNALVEKLKILNTVDYDK